VVVGNIPSSDSSGRLILLPKASAQYSSLSDSKRAKKKSGYKIGSLVEAEVHLFSVTTLKLLTVFHFQFLQTSLTQIFFGHQIIDIKPLELLLKFGGNLHGRIHITEVNTRNCLRCLSYAIHIG
jgi:rRNA biogenesis protein RRP5